MQKQGAQYDTSNGNIEKENQISEDTSILVYSLSLNHTSIRGRIAGSSRKTPEGNKLYFINNTALNPFQTLHVYEDVARMKCCNPGKIRISLPHES